MRELKEVFQLGKSVRQLRVVCVTLWHSEKAGMNDPFGVNRRLSEMIEGAYGGHSSLDLL